MSKISGQLLISGQFQDNCEISGISGQLGALIFQMNTVNMKGKMTSFFETHNAYNPLQ